MSVFSPDERGEVTLSEQCKSLTPLTELQLKSLMSFVGYGSLEAPIWFIGLEEAGGGEERLRTRSSFDAVMDIEKAHVLIGETSNFGPTAEQQRTWWNMCELMLILAGTPEPSPVERLSYQTQRLGRLDGETLLLEVMPFPCPSLSDWNYPNVLPQYRSREECHSDLRPQRLSFLRRLVEVHEPKVVITYGGNDKQPFRNLFTDWSIQRGALFDVGMRGNTLIILSKHFIYRSSRKCRAMACTIADVHPHLLKVPSLRPVIC